MLEDTCMSRFTVQFSQTKTFWRNCKIMHSFDINAYPPPPTLLCISWSHTTWMEPWCHAFLGLTWFLVPRYSVVCIVEPLSLLYLLFVSWFVCIWGWCIGKLGFLHVHQISLRLDPYRNYGRGWYPLNSCFSSFFLLLTVQKCCFFFILFIICV